MGKPTNTTSFKTFARREGLETAEGVVLHGAWKKQRKRGLSLAFNGERNPRKALRLALEASGLEANSTSLRETFDGRHRVMIGLDQGEEAWDIL